MDLGGVITVLVECEEFVGYFGSDRADALLPQIKAAQDYMKGICKTGVAVNISYIPTPPCGPVRIENIEREMDHGTSESLPREEHRRPDEVARDAGQTSATTSALRY